MDHFHSELDTAHNREWCIPLTQTQRDIRKRWRQKDLKMAKCSEKSCRKALDLVADPYVYAKIVTQLAVCVDAGMS